MSVVPGSVDTDRQPPMAVPLQHFVLGLCFLLAGLGVGLWDVLGGGAGHSGLAHVHLLLVGWVCLTIMGAMTQFVPVWSGVDLYSRRLARRQLWLVVAGIAGFAGLLLLGELSWLAAPATLMLAGFWVFAYNVARSLWAGRPWDVTERHFAAALAFFVLATGLGYLLALDFTRPLFASLPVTRSGVIGAHVTLAVFGAVLTTVLGALYQLATMFTQTELHGLERPFRRFETVGYPLGVLLLAAGRLVATAWLAQVGALLVVVSVLGMAIVVARRLLETQVAWTPMLSRYAVVALAMAGWAVGALVAWSRAPLARASLLGPAGATHLLLLGVVGFVVLGTLYHIVPFIVWVHRYSDRLGFEPVPMIDDLYDSRVAALDFALLTCGTLLLLAQWVTLPTPAAAAGGTLVLVGAAVFCVNMVWLLRRHSPASLQDIVFGRPSA